jgi:tetratricopeptide (TPR) repeat protein
MSDRHASDPAPAPHEVSPDIDSRVESLLLTGLDRYFAGEYERAISAWTRVLFLDRGHPRAKAYIDRARAVLAERQRQSEELLHRGVAAFNRGEAANARALLQSAVEQGGPQDVALAFLERLERLDRPVAPAESSGARRARRRRPRLAGEPGRPRVRRWRLPILVLALVGAGAFYVMASRHRAAPLLFLMDGGQAPRPAAPAAQPVLPERLIVPRAADIALERARALLASGHPRDALRLVEQVRAGDPARDQADALRAQIQAALLSAAAPPAAPVPESRRP